VFQISNTRTPITIKTQPLRKTTNPLWRVPTLMYSFILWWNQKYISILHRNIGCSTYTIHPLKETPNHNAKRRIVFDENQRWCVLSYFPKPKTYKYTSSYYRLFQIFINPITIKTNHYAKPRILCADSQRWSILPYFHETKNI